MARTTLEARVARLEAQIVRLSDEVRAGGQRADEGWRRRRPLCGRRGLAERPRGCDETQGGEARRTDGAKRHPEATTMILLDTDHLSVLLEPGTRSGPGFRASRATDEKPAIPVVSVEEQLRLARPNPPRPRFPWADPRLPAAEQAHFLPTQLDHRRLGDNTAAATFDRLRENRIRIGMQDLKIASIALANDALLLSANLRNFNRFPVSASKIGTTQTPSDRRCRLLRQSNGQPMAFGSQTVIGAGRRTVSPCHMIRSSRPRSIMTPTEKRAGRSWRSCSPILPRTRWPRRAGSPSPGRWNSCRHGRPRTASRGLPDAAGERDAADHRLLPPQNAEATVPAFSYRYLHHTAREHTRRLSGPCTYGDTSSAT